jgi:hypothetical protein
MPTDLYRSIEAPCGPPEAEGECARPVEFPEGNPIPQGELVQFNLSSVCYIFSVDSEGKDKKSFRGTEAGWGVVMLGDLLFVNLNNQEV